jgi:hypothetical protein
MSVSLLTKFATVAHQAEWQSLRATEKWVKFLTLREGINIINHGRTKFRS